MYRVRLLLSSRLQSQVEARAVVARRFVSSGPAAPSPSQSQSPSPVQPSSDKTKATKWRKTGFDSPHLTGGVMLRPNYLALEKAKNVGLPLTLSKSWLRDSCPCEQCVDPHSGQKRFVEADVALAPPVLSASLMPDQSLRVEWANDDLIVGGGGGTHESVYPKDLWERGLIHRQKRRRPEYATLTRPRQLWDKALFESSLRFVPYSDWMQGGPAFWRALLDLHEKGLILLDGVPESETAVTDIANQIGVVQSTFYGTTWDVVSKPRAENVAYTSEFLGLHQDLCYTSIPPYIQLLHCLRNECDGGESLFSDGIKAAVQLNLADPAAARLLTGVPVRYKYHRGGHYYTHQQHVFRVSPNTLRKQQPGGGRAAAAAAATAAAAASSHQTRFDSCAWSPPFQDIQSSLDHSTAWRRAAKSFSSIISAPENVFELKLKPGQCVLFNNQRILHGRRQFDTSSGHRWLKGAYIEKQVFQSKLQHLPDDIPAEPMLAEIEEVGEHESAQVTRLMAAQSP